jgi:hypothetical protein
MRKAMALVAYLAVEKRSFSREFLGDLRGTLSIVRGALGNECVVTEGDQVRLNQALIQVDIDEWNEAAHRPTTLTRLALQPML